MDNLNRGTKTKYLRQEGNMNHFRDQNAGNKSEINLGNTETQANFLKGTRTSLGRASPLETVSHFFFSPESISGLTL